MKRTILALLVAAFAVTGATAQVNSEAKSDRQLTVVAQASNMGTSATTTTPAIVLPSAPATYDQAPTTTTVTVKGGDFLAKLLDWIWVAFGGVITGGIVLGIQRILAYFKIQTTESQKMQLEAIVVNAVNSGAVQAQKALRSIDKLDITSKNQIVNAAIDYTQRHASDTIRALGFDPKSGEAVEAIRARIEKVLNDPTKPTPPVITPPSGMPHQPLAPSA